MKNKGLKILILFFVCCSSVAYSQKSITFQVEELPKPQNALTTMKYGKLWENMWFYEYHNQGYNKPEIPLLNKLAQSQAPDSLVAFYFKGRNHPFFYGMYQAYADHRPFVLSPDMIWLLICQGFAQHVNADPEKMRPYFVQHSGKLSLVVRNDCITLNNPDSPWEEVFPEFTRQIAAHTGKDLTDLMTADFSTTSPVSKLASEATLMYAMKAYFEFIVMKVACGIPEITLEGTSEDWQKVLEKTKRLAKYDLKWWTKELEPLLAEFVKASKGTVNKKFWQGMFKYHSPEKYAADNIIDGWIVKFFPYDKKGKRNNLKELEGCDNLPGEIVKVELKHVEVNPKDGASIETPLELWAGFIGSEQNEKTMTLKPVIAWMIRKKEISNDAILQRFKADAENGESFGRGINIRVKEIPEEIFALDHIKRLTVYFTDKIVIPEKLSKVKIDRLDLHGEINDTEIRRIKKMFRNNILMINGESHGEIDGKWKVVATNDSLFTFMAPGNSRPVYSEADIDSIYSAFNKQFFSPSKGIYSEKSNKRGKVAAIWTQAIFLDIAENAYLRTRSEKDSLFFQTLLEGNRKYYDNFNWDNGKVWFIYDDIMWWVISLARTYQLTGETKWMDLSASGFERVWSGSKVLKDNGSYDPVRGGMYWAWSQEHPEGTPAPSMGKMACINYPTVIGAMTLFEATRDSSYFKKGLEIYAWSRNNLFDKTNGRVADSRHGNGRPAWKMHVYNQATCIGAAMILYKATGDNNYLEDAILAADYTKNQMSANGFLHFENGIEQGIYHAIFAQYIIRLIEDGKQRQYLPWLYDNLNTGWANRIKSNNITYKDYARPAPEIEKIESYDASGIPALMQVIK